IASWEMELTRLTSAILESEAARDSVRDSLGAIEHRLSALREIVRSREGNAAAAREALARAGMTEQGTLSRRLRPAPGWEGAVDSVVGGDPEPSTAAGAAAPAGKPPRRLPAARMARADWRAADKGSIPAGPPGGWEIALSNFAELSPAERAA